MSKVNFLLIGANWVSHIKKSGKFFEISGLLKNRWQLQLQFVRFRNKINITRPRPPHFERALVETLCIPKFATKRKLQHIPDYESCNKQVVKAEEKEHPLKNILIKDCKSYFESSKLIAFFHVNKLVDEEQFQCQLLLKKNGMKLVFLNRSIMEKAFTGTIYESILQFYKAPTATAFSREADIYKLLSIFKKLPKLVLMGAIVEGRLMSLSELQTFGKFQNITEARSALVSVLNSASQTLVQQINYHPTILVELLNQHKKLLEDK